MGIYDSFDNKSDPNHALWAVMTAGNTLADKQNNLIKESYQPIVDWDKARAKSTTQAYLDYLSGLTDKQLSDEFMKGETDLLDSTRSAAMQGGIRLDLSDANWKAIQDQRARAQKFAQGEFDTEFNKNLTREQAEQAWKNNSQNALAEQAAKAYNGRVNLDNAKQSVDTMFDTVRKEELLNRMSQGATLDDIYNDNRFVRKGHELEDKLYNYDTVNSARLESIKEKLASDIRAAGIDPNDTNSVIEYIRNHRDEYGIDPDRLVTKMSTWFAPAGATVKDNSQDQIAQAGNTKVKRYTDLLNSGKELTTDDYNTIFSDSDITSAKDSNKLYGRAISEFLGKDPIFTDIRKAFQNNFRNSQGDLMSFELVQRRINEAGLKGKLTPEALQRVNTVVGTMYQSSLRAHTEEKLQKAQQNLLNTHNKLKNVGMRYHSADDWLEGGIFPGGTLQESDEITTDLANQVFRDYKDIINNGAARLNALNDILAYSKIPRSKLEEAAKAYRDDNDSSKITDLANSIRASFRDPAIREYFKNFGDMARIANDYRTQSNETKVLSMSQQSKQ